MFWICRALLQVTKYIFSPILHGYYNIIKCEFNDLLGDPPKIDPLDFSATGSLHGQNSGDPARG